MALRLPGELTRRGLIHVYETIPMSLQNRRWADVGHRSFQSASYGLGFAPVRHGHNYATALHDLSNAHRNSPGRHIVERCEPPLAQLLATTLLVEVDYDVRRFRFKIRRRIIERKVSIFTDAHKRRINGVFAYESSQSIALGLRVCGAAVDKVDCRQARHQFNKPLTQIPAETRRMVFIETDVLIEVKHRYPGPVDIAGRHKMAEGLKLAGARGENDISPGVV